MKGMRKGRLQLKGGIGAAAVIVIIVVIAAVGIGSYYFMAGGEGVAPPSRNIHLSSYTWGSAI